MDAFVNHALNLIMCVNYFLIDQNESYIENKNCTDLHGLISILKNKADYIKQSNIKVVQQTNMVFDSLKNI